MRKRVSKNKMRSIIAISYLIQTVMLVVLVIFFPHLIAFQAFGMTLFMIYNAVFSFYLFSLKNVKGWWSRKIFEANQRISLKKSVEAEYRRRLGMGYDKLERGKAL